MFRIASLALPTLLLLAPHALAQTCTATTYGDACGITAEGSTSPNGATYRVAFTVHAEPRTVVLFFVGVFEGKVPLAPISSCFLLVDPILFTQQHRTDATGTYTFSKALPHGTMGVARIQFASVEFDQNNQLVVKTSNGIKLDCQ